jgi:hypothetical protein
MRIESVLDKSDERGVPSQAPEGINPAPLGSTFDKRSIPPTLSAAERKRVTEIAEIFRKILIPQEEAKVAEQPGIQPKESTESLLHLFTQQQAQQGQEGGGGGIMGIVSGLLGGIGGTGSAAAIAASSLPILAGFIGAGVLAIAGGFAFKLVMEALKVAKDVDWDAVGNAGDTLIKGLGGLMGVLQGFIGFLIDKGLDVIDKMFDIWRRNIEQIAISIGTLGQSLKEYKDIKWEDVGKGLATIFGALALATVSGNPAIALMASLGSMVMSFAGAGMSAIGSGLKILADGMEDMLVTIDKYSNLDMIGFSKSMYTMFSIMATLGGMGLAAPLEIVGAAAAKIGGWGMEGLSEGVEAMGDAMIPLSIGLERFQQLDPDKLKQMGFSLGSIGVGLSKYAVGGGLTAIASGLAELFGGSGINDLIRFADKHTELMVAGSGLFKIVNAFQEWKNVDMKGLAWDLRNIEESIDDLDIRKLERMGSVVMRMSDQATEKLHGYFTTGRSASDAGNGLISLTKGILEENRKQVRTLQDIKTVLSNIGNDKQGTIFGQGHAGQQPGKLDTRGALFGGLTL